MGKISLLSDNKDKGILILGEEPTQGLHNTTSTEEVKHPINFTQPRKIFVLNLHYNVSSNLIFANVTKIYQFKPKNSEIKAYALCLSNF